MKTSTRWPEPVRGYSTSEADANLCADYQLGCTDARLCDRHNLRLASIRIHARPEVN